MTMLLLLLQCKQTLHVCVGKAQAQEDGRLQGWVGCEGGTFRLYHLEGRSLTLY